MTFAKGHKTNVGSKRSAETRKMLSDCKLGVKNPMYGKHQSEESRKKKSIALTGLKRSEEEIKKSADARRGRRTTPETKQKLSVSHKKENLSAETIEKMAKAKRGHRASNETRELMSATRKGENNPCWRGGISFYPYCDKFDNTCRERVRDEFGRKCLNCDLQESENLTKTGVKKRLSVHHIYYDKQEGCNGKDMFLAPLCLKCHNKTTTGNREHWMQDLSEKRSQYLTTH